MVSAPLSGSMAVAGDELEEEFQVSQKGKQEGISQGSDQQEFHA